MPEQAIENPVLEPDTPTVDDTQVVPEEPDSPPSEAEDTPTEQQPGASEVSTEDTDWKKRHGDAVRWAQREAEARARLEKKLQEMESRFSKLKELGIDPEDLVSYTEEATQGADYVPKTEFEKAVQSVRGELWNTAKMIFVTANPEFKDPDLNRLLDYECSRIAQEEMNSSGAFNLSADQLLAKGATRVKKFINKLKGEGAKSAVEKRKKIAESGIFEGKEPASKKVEEEIPSPDSVWVSNHRKTQQRVRTKA